MTGAADSGNSRVEVRGIEFVPEGERTSRPLNVFVVMAAGQLSFIIIAIGFVPNALGLSFKAALVSILLGIAIGAPFFAPSAVLGPLSGTNGPVASGAFFGVKGRLIGSLIGVFIAIGAVGITVWISGEVLILGVGRLTKTQFGDGALAVAYAIISISCIIAAIYGHAIIVRMLWLLAIPVACILVAGCLFYWPDAWQSAPAGEYAVGSFAATMTSAVVINAGAAVSYALQVNDYSRYISRHRYSNRMTALCAGGGVATGLILALGFGAVVAAAASSSDVVASVVSGAPVWLLCGLLLVALAGGLGQSVIDLYSTGLDTSSLIPRLKRIPATLTISSVSLAVVYLGAFVWDATDAVSAFVSILVILTAPWLTISYAGLVAHGFSIDPDDLQIFNRGGRGGRYWYRGGWNVSAVAAWTVAVTFGLLFSQTAAFTGPLSSLTGGIDFSVFISGLLGVAVFWAFGRGHSLVEEVFPDAQTDSPEPDQKVPASG